MAGSILTDSNAEKDAWLSHYIKTRIEAGAVLNKNRVRAEILPPWSNGEDGRLSIARIGRVIEQLYRAKVLRKCAEKMEYKGKMITHWQIIAESEPNKELRD